VHFVRGFNPDNLAADLCWINRQFLGRVTVRKELDCPTTSSMTGSGSKAANPSHPTARRHRGAARVLTARASHLQHQNQAAAAAMRISPIMSRPPD
jgi:hypothetical protein